VQFQNRTHLTQSWRKRSLGLAHVASLFLFVLLLLGAGDDSVRFKSAGHHLMCVCGCNYVLLECNHVGCPYSEQMRAELAAAVDRGDNDDRIMQVFVQKYGPMVLLAPTTTGFNRIAWIMPYAALVVGFTIVYFIVRAWRKRPAPPIADGIVPAPGPLTDRYREQAHRETEL
jgi:cytochrome c-type biogenesis protein CcmH